MRIFFDTEFNGFHASSVLISIGLVSESGRECYVELSPRGLHLDGAIELVIKRVVSQFGKVPGACVSDRIEMSDRVTDFLKSFSGPLVLCYDYKLDWHHIETLVAHDRLLMSRIQHCQIAADVSSDVSRAAGADALAAVAYRGIGEFHALADALALRAAWLARPTA